MEYKPARDEEKENAPSIRNTFAASGYLPQTSTIPQNNPISNTQLVALLKAAYDACIIQDMETGRVLLWNQGATALYGWSEAEALGRKLDEMLGKQSSESHNEMYCVLEKQKHWEGELIHTKRDGMCIFVDSRCVRLEQSENTPSVLLQINRDSTELKHALANSYLLAEFSKYLTASLDYHEALANIARLAISSLTDWCRVELLKDRQKVQQLTITRIEANASVPVWENVPAGPRYAVPMATAFYPYVTDQFLFSMANDEQDFASLRGGNFGSAIFVPVCLQTKVVGTFLLLTERTRSYTKDDLSLVEELAKRVALAIEKAHMYQDLQELNRNLESIVEHRTAVLMETTETLRQLNTELGRSNQELQDFAHVASHDLQEPLRKIQAFGNLLEEEHGAELGEGKMYLERMRSAAARMQILINDLLAFARITTKAQPFIPVDLNIIAREVLDDLETRVSLSAGKIELGQLPVIDADPLQMRQVLQNLLGNALKFQRAGIPPRVRVDARVQYIPNENETELVQAAGEAYCWLTVEDNGIGFDEKYLDRIFTVFQRLHGRNDYPGTGIGLAVVRKIVLRHRGAITAKSVPGEGSTFLVQLPISQTMKDENPYVG